MKQRKKRNRTIRSNRSDSYKFAAELMDIALARRPKATLFQYPNKRIALSVRQSCYAYRTALLNEQKKAAKEALLKSNEHHPDKLFSEDGESVDISIEKEIEINEMTTPYHDLYLREPYENDDGTWILSMSFENPRLKENLLNILDEEGTPLDI